MRHIALFFLISCGIAQVSWAQNQPPVSPQLRIDPKLLKTDIQIKPELNFNGEPQQVNRATKPRVVRVAVRNSGAIFANNFVVEVTYNWRIDHESFTSQTLKRSQSIATLAAGQQSIVEFVVPDELIRRNAPYGTPNVSLTFKVDATGVVTEMSENNNTASFSLPILNQ